MFVTAEEPYFLEGFAEAVYQGEGVFPLVVCGQHNVLFDELH